MIIQRLRTVLSLGFEMFFDIWMGREWENMVINSAVILVTILGLSFYFDFQHS